MPQKQNMYKIKDDLGDGVKSEVGVLNKYEKRERISNDHRPEGNWGLIKGISNPDGSIEVPGAIQKRIEKNGLILPELAAYRDERDLLNRDEHLILTPQQLAFILLRHQLTWFCAGIGSGKCLGKDTPVMLFNGDVVPVQDIIPGMQLMGPDFRPRTVLSTTSGQDELFRIEPIGETCQRPYVVNSCHILTLLPEHNSSYDLAFDVPINELGPGKNGLTFTAFAGKVLEANHFRVVPIGTGQYFGFELDGDGRFLLGDFTVTHNTFVGAVFTVLQVFSNPETIGLICSPTYYQLNQSTLKPLLHLLDSWKIPYVVNRIPPKEWGVARLFPEYDNIMVFPNGAHIFLRSLDNPGSIAGLTIGWFWLDEMIFATQKAFEIVLGRLRCPKSVWPVGRITSSPNGHDWLYKMFANPKNAHIFKIIFQSARENPHLPPEFIPRLEASYDPIMARQEIDGRIISIQFGRSYYNFSEVNHVKDRYPYDPNRPLMLCWDFNSGEAPMSTVLAQEWINNLTGLPEIQVIDEIVQKYSDTPQNTALFIERYKGHRGGIQIYGDAYGSKTTSKSDYQVIVDMLQPLFRNVELHISNSNPTQMDRLTSVNTLFRNSRNQRRLYISDKCQALINDFKNVRPANHDKSKIHKLNIELTHPSDALSYMIFKRYPVQRVSFQSVKMEQRILLGGR